MRVLLHGMHWMAVMIVAAVEGRHEEAIDLETRFTLWAEDLFKEGEKDGE